MELDGTGLVILRKKEREKESKPDCEQFNVGTSFFLYHCTDKSVRLLMDENATAS